MTMRKVLTQPHLEGAGSNYSFLGFLFLSIANGVGAILSAAAAAVIIVLYRTKQKK